MRIKATILFLVLSAVLLSAQPIMFMGSSQTAPPANKILDTYPGAGTAGGVRLLDKDYTGPLVRIRRDFDGQEEDFYPNSAGELGLDSQNQSGSTTLNAFCTEVGNRKRVNILYDQTGSGNDWTVNSNFSGPELTDLNSNFHYQNGKLAMYFIASGDELECTYNPPQDPYTATVVMTTPANMDGIPVGLSTGASQIYIAYCPGSSSDPEYWHSDDGSIANPTRTTAQHLNSLFVANINAQFYRDGTAIGTQGSAAQPPQTSATPLTLGAAQDGSFDGDPYIQEIIIWPVDQTSNRNGIESDIKNFYGIP